jgi:hypothetical protein
VVAPPGFFFTGSDPDPKPDGGNQQHCCRDQDHPFSIVHFTQFPHLLALRRVAARHEIPGDG